MKRKLLLAMLCIVCALPMRAQWTAYEASAGYALLYNVGKDQYFTKGNGWGTQASMGARSDAIRVELIPNGNNYFIRTGVNGTNRGLEYLNGGTVYTDQSIDKQSTWTFSQVGTDNGPVYNIISADNHGGGSGAYLSANGDNTIVGPAADGSSNYAKWKVIPMTYYLQNEGSGLFFGGGTSWGTQATLIQEGIDIDFYPNGDGFSLDTKLSNGGANHFLNGNFLDGAATPIYFTETSPDSGLYTMSQTTDPSDYYGYDGTNRAVVTNLSDATSANAQWRLLPKQYFMNRLSSATYANPVDATFLLTNYRLNRNDTRMTGAWTETAEGGTNTWGSINANQNNNDYSPEFYNCTFDVHQSVTGLPAGVYEVSVAGFNRDGRTVLYGNSTEIPIYGGQVGNYAAAKTAIANYTMPRTHTGTFYISDGNLTFGVKRDALVSATDWTVFNDFRLTYYGPYDSDEPNTNVAIPNPVPVINGDNWIVSQTPTYDPVNMCAEYWNKGGANISQTLADLPEGYYSLTAVALTRTGMTATLSADGNSMNIATVGSAEVNDRGGANTWFNAGNGVNTLIVHHEADGDMVIQLTADNTTGDHWMLWRSFQLTNLGFPMAYTTEELEDAVNEAEGLYSSIPTAAKTALKAVVDAQNITYDTGKKYHDAAVAVKAATATYASSAIVAAYAKYKALKAAVDALDDDTDVFEGSYTVNTSTTSATVEAATTVGGIEAGYALLRADANTFLTAIATHFNTDQYLDITDVFLENADFSAGNIDGWDTNFGEGGRAQNFGYQGASYTNGGVSVNRFIEAWKRDAVLGDGYLRQSVSGLPEGTYKLEADAIAVWQNNPATETTGAYLYINADDLDYKTALNTGNAAPEHFLAQFLYTGYDSEDPNPVLFGLKTESTNCNWICADNFTVKYYGFDLSSYETLLATAIAEAEAVEGTVPTAAYTALSSVVTANSSPAENSKAYTAAISAIETATATATALQPAYTEYNRIKALVLALDDDATVYSGGATVDVSSADTEVAAATTVAGINDAITTLKTIATTFVTGVTVNSGKYFDMTEIWITNPTVSVNTTGWSIDYPEGYPNTSYSYNTTNYGETEFYQQNFDFYQNLTLPRGTYEFGVTGFHRAGDHATYFYAGSDDRILIPGVASDVVNSMAGAQTHFNNGNGKVALNFALEDVSQTIKIGIVNNDTQTDKWTIFRNFTLHYYGSAVDLSTYSSLLDDAIDRFEALTASTLPTAAYGAIQDIVDDIESDRSSYTHKQEYLDAIEDIDDAIATYASTEIVNAYAKYKEVRTAILAINSSLDISSANTAVEAATTVSGVNTALGTLRNTFGTYLNTSGATDVDVTAVWLENPGFEMGNTNGWTNSGEQTVVAQNNEGLATKTGTYYAECWHKTGTVDIHQTVANLGAGVYQISARLYCETNDGRLYAEGLSTDAKASDIYTVQAVADNNGSITFGASCTLTNSTWICMDNFQLTYVSNTLPSVTEATGIMEGSVSTAQTTAISAYEASATAANYYAALTAIDNAQASIDAYVSAKAYIDRMEEGLEISNFYTTAAYNQYYKDIKDNYDARTLPTNVAATLNAEEAYQAGVTYQKANHLDDILLSAWTIDDTPCSNYDADLYINTWSVEGNTDGSEFYTPFFEYWVADGNVLATKEFVATKTGLTASTEYAVSLRGRVRQTNNQTKIANGITMQVGSGSTVDISAGSKYKKTQFYLGNFFATGSTDGDGTLTLTINVAEGSNISWLSFRNVKYYTASDLASVLAALKSEAAALLASGEYNNETCYERSHLTTLKDDASTPANLSAYVTAVNNLMDAIDLFKENKADYASLTAEKAKAIALGVASATVSSCLSTSKTALEATQDIKVAEYDYVDTNFGYAVDLGTWSHSDNVGIMTSQHWDGTSTSTYMEQGAGNLAYNLPNWEVNYYQNLLLPAGNYIFKVAGRTASTDVTVTLNVTDVTDPLNPSVLGTVNDFPKGDVGLGINTSGATDFTTGEGHTYANAGNGRGWEWRYVKFTLSDPATVKVSVDATATAQHRWMGFCNPTVQTDDEDNVTLMENLVALNDAKLAATLTKIDYNIGTGIFQYNETTNNSLWSAYSTAKTNADAFTLTGETTPSSVSTLTTALTTAQANYENQALNQPNAEKRYWLTIHEDGKAWDGNAITFIEGGLNDQGLYGIKYLTPANANLTQAIKLTPTGTNNNFKVSVLRPDGEEQYLTTGSTYGGNDNQIRTTDDEDEASWVKIVPTETDNQFYIYNVTTGTKIANNNNNDVYTAGSANFTIAEASKLTVTASAKAGKNGTVIFPFKPDVSDAAFDNIKFYTCDDVSESGYVQMTEVAEPEAKTPYLIRNDGGSDVSVNLSDYSTLTEDDYDDGNVEGLLTGVYQVSTIPHSEENGEIRYALQTKKSTGVQAFYRVSYTTDLEGLPAYKAYLTLPAAAGVKEVFFLDFSGMETDINSVETSEEDRDAVIYNLAGQRVSKTTKGGVYIVNGKKVLVK